MTRKGTDSNESVAAIMASISSVHYSASQCEMCFMTFFSLLTMNVANFQSLIRVNYLTTIDSHPAKYLHQMAARTRIELVFPG